MLTSDPELVGHSHCPLCFHATVKSKSKLSTLETGHYVLITALLWVGAPLYLCQKDQVMNIFKEQFIKMVTGTAKPNGSVTVKLTKRSVPVPRKCLVFTSEGGA